MLRQLIQLRDILFQFSQFVEAFFKVAKFPFGVVECLLSFMQVLQLRFGTGLASTLAKLFAGFGNILAGNFLGPFDQFLKQRMLLKFLTDRLQFFRKFELIGRDARQLFVVLERFSLAGGLIQFVFQPSGFLAVSSNLFADLCDFVAKFLLLSGQLLLVQRIRGG